MPVSKPPKGGTLAAVGAASPDARNNLSPSEFRVYAEHRQFTETVLVVRFTKLFRLKAGL
ncbi:MAG: hypothetical protein GX456_01850 [Verrucomicrobia bacterium]|nr:hypothetical protein [Verrucomicrobiota bacterium]